VGPSSVLSVAGSTSSAPNVTRPSFMQGSIGMLFSTLGVGGPTPTMPSVGGHTSTQSLSQSSSGSSIDLPLAPPSTPTNIGASNQGVPAGRTTGLYQFYMCLYVY